MTEQNRSIGRPQADIVIEPAVEPDLIRACWACRYRDAQRGGMSPANEGLAATLLYPSVTFTVVAFEQPDLSGDEQTRVPHRRVRIGAAIT